MDEKTFIDLVIAWLASGGVGIALSWFVSWLCLAWPGFQKVWKAQTSQLQQGIMLLAGVGLSVLVYWLVVLTPYLAQPTTLLGWVVALFPIVFIEFGVGELFYKQVTKRRR